MSDATATVHVSLDEVIMEAFAQGLQNNPDETRFFVNQRAHDGQMWFLALVEEAMMLTCEDQRVLVQAGFSRVSIKLDRLPRGQQKFDYQVVSCEGVLRFAGSFLLPDASAMARVAFVSCNDNPATSTLEWNKYHDGHAGGWEQLLMLDRPQLVVHLGDNVYADQVWLDYSEGHIDLLQAGVRLARLYQRSFSSAAQGTVMRSAHNLMMIDDHDVAKGFGAPALGISSAGSQKQYNYIQLALRLAEHFCMKAEPYQFCGTLYVPCDTRRALDAHTERFPDELINAVDRRLAHVATGDKAVVCLPQPLVNASSWFARLLVAAGHSDGYDESLHPLNEEGMLRFRKVLAKHSARLGEGGLRVVAGDIHVGRQQTHHVKLADGSWAVVEEAISSPITRVPRKREKLRHRLGLAVQDHCHLLWFTHKVRNVRGRVHGNNYGIIDEGCRDGPPGVRVVQVEN